MSTANAILETLQSSNLHGSNLSPANVVDVINELALATGRVAKAITPPHEGTDAAGVHVESLTESMMGVTESMMGVTAGLCRIAEAIESLAGAVRERRP